MDRASVEVGFSSVPVVLDQAVAMSGFAARTSLSSGTGCPPPRASAIAIGDVTMVFLDTIGVDPALADEIRQHAGAVGAVSVAATHTHAGPCVLSQGLGSLSRYAFETWVAAGARAARLARGDRRAATAEWLEPVVPGVATDRRRGVVSADARLTAIRFTGLDGDVVGVLASYPCHPTTLGPLNLELSGDYPGFLRTRAEELFGGTCVFATGCAGDINTGHAATASYLLGRGDAGRTMADARDIGGRLAESLMNGDWSHLDLRQGVQFWRGGVCLDQRPLESDPPELLARRWEAEKVSADPGMASLLDVWIEWAQLAGSGRVARWEGDIARLRIGEATLFLLPGEPFLAADRMLREVAGDRTMVVGYWEDCPGYFPSATEYALGGYEVLDAHRYYGMPAPFEEGALERLVRAAASLGPTSGVGLVSG